MSNFEVLPNLKLFRTCFKSATVYHWLVNTTDQIDPSTCFFKF